MLIILSGYRFVSCPLVGVLAVTWLMTSAFFAGVLEGRLTIRRFIYICSSLPWFERTVYRDPFLRI